MLFPGKNVINITLRVFNEGRDELVCLSRCISRSLDRNYTAAGCFLPIGININVGSSCFTNSVDITPSSPNHTTDDRRRNGHFLGPSYNLLPAILVFFTLLGTRQGGHFSSSCCCGEGDGETLGGRSGHGDGGQSTMGSSLSHDGTGNYFGDLSSFHNTDHISRLSS